MTSVPISKFKARCLAMLEEVRKTGKPLRVTRFGKPIADIVPAAQSVPPSWLGLLSDGDIHGDLITPAAEHVSWEALASFERTRAKRRP
jgi:prevent-host-death family protein